jgi:mRNA interferase RelE/StbE
VYVTPSALREIKDLPGNMRQRIKRAIDDLADNPHPSESQALSLTDIESPIEAEYEIRRLRLDKWRVMYAVQESNKIVDILAVRKRPPYDYGDLAQLLADIK